MLEIIVVWRLCKKNAADAATRGRPMGTAYLYTIATWIFAEGLGIFIGAAIAHALGWPIKLAVLWVFAFAFALLISLLTRLVARR